MNRDEGTERPKSHFRFLLSLLAVAGGATAYIRGPLQRRKLFLPERYPAGDWAPRKQGLPAEDQWFDSGDGVRLHGWWLPRSGAAVTVLYCHGHSGCLGRRLDVLRTLYDLPAQVFAFDYRGYGRSTGKPSAVGLRLDARAAAAHLHRELGQDPGRTVLFGHSLGAALALEAALAMQGERPVAGLILESAFTSVHEVTRQRYPFLPLHLLTKDPYRNIEQVAQVRCPQLFVHGTADHVMPPRHSERLWQAARGSKELYLVEGAGHNDLHEVGGTAYARRLGAFISSCVETAGSRR